jgi:hypothetical protein
MKFQLLNHFTGRKNSEICLSAVLWGKPDQRTKVVGSSSARRSGFALFNPAELYTLRAFQSIQPLQLLTDIGRLEGT